MARDKQFGAALSTAAAAATAADSSAVKPPRAVGRWATNLLTTSKGTQSNYHFYAFVIYVRPSDFASNNQANYKGNFLC